MCCCKCLIFHTQTQTQVKCPAQKEIKSIHPVSHKNPSIKGKVKSEEDGVGVGVTTEWEIHRSVILTPICSRGCFLMINHWCSGAGVGVWPRSRELSFQVLM